MRTSLFFLFSVSLLSSPVLAGTPSDSDMQSMLNDYCTQCHNAQHAHAGEVLDSLDGARAAAKKAVNELNAGKMPPQQATQPSPADHDAMLAWFQAQ
jgi:hypothetical protein